MTAAEIVASRIAPFWLKPDQITHRTAEDADLAMRQRYLKADGKSLTQFNTGAIVIRTGTVLALTECQPARPDPGIRLAPTAKSRSAVIDDIRTHGPPLLAVMFKKGATDVSSWVCCTPDEVVLNGPAGPEEVAVMEDVAFLRQLPGALRNWRTAANLYAAATADPAQADRLYAEVDRLADAVSMPGDQVLNTLHHIHRVERLAYELAEPAGRSA
jgi:hypothetical protein